MNRIRISHPTLKQVNAINRLILVTAMLFIQSMLILLANRHYIIRLCKGITFFRR